MEGKSVFRKSLVIGIIILFVGAGVVPSISGDIEKKVMMKNNFKDEPPEEEWNKTYNYSTSTFNHGNYVQQTNDGGYIIAGGTSYGSPIDTLLIKTNKKGDIEWDKIYMTGIHHDEGMYVHQTIDGGYIVIGYGFCYEGTFWDARMFKTDSNGNLIWEKFYGGTEQERGYYGQITDDGGYIITGNTESFGTGDNFNLWLVKTDVDGNMQWNKTFGGDLYDSGYSVQQTNDGGYIITGHTGLYSSGDYDVWLIKTDGNGNLQWDKTFGGDLYDSGYSVQQTNDNGYIITGSTESFGAGESDVWLIKTDSNGNIQWDKTIGSANKDGGKSVLQTNDGGYIITGYTQSFGAGGSDVWLIKTDSNGDEIWDITFGGIYDDMGNSVQIPSDMGYIITGFKTYDQNDEYLWLIKIKGDNEPPNAPIIDGETNGNAGTEYEYTFNAVDPDSDNVKYHIDWDDGDSEETDFSPSGTDVKVKHTWNSEGTYTITAYAEDTTGLVGPTGTLTVTMPRNRAMNTPFLNFLQQYPNLFPLLQLLLQRLGLQ